MLHFWCVGLCFRNGVYQKLEGKVLATYHGAIIEVETGAPSDGTKVWNGQKIEITFRKPDDGLNESGMLERKFYPPEVKWYSAPVSPEEISGAHVRLMDIDRQFLVEGEIEVAMEGGSMGVRFSVS